MNDQEMIDVYLFHVPYKVSAIYKFESYIGSIEALRIGGKQGYEKRHLIGFTIKKSIAKRFRKNLQPIVQYTKIPIPESDYDNFISVYEECILREYNICTGREDSSGKIIDKRYVLPDNIFLALGNSLLDVSLSMLDNYILSHRDRMYDVFSQILSPVSLAIDNDYFDKDSTVNEYIIQRKYVKAIRYLGLDIIMNYSIHTDFDDGFDDYEYIHASYLQNDVALLKEAFKELFTDKEWK